MATSENVAFARRLDTVEQAVNGLQLMWVRTTVVVYDRQVEPEYTSLAEISDAAIHEPRPIELRRIPDLELLLDPVTQARTLRNTLSAAGRAKFDAMKLRAQLVDIEISCHENQLAAILSNSLTTAAIGGNRSGKSMILVFWLLRRWIMRGGPGRVFWWVSPSVAKRFAQGVYAIAGQRALGGGRWPDALMLLPKRGISTTTRVPRIEMVDGSVIEFMHAAGDGGNLKSENVVDIVLDELGEIDDPDNFHQAKIRVSQTGGRVATATTRKRGHWMDEEITKRAADEGPEVVHLTEFDLFDSPWMTYARIFELFVNDKTLTRRQLEQQVLPALDKRAKCLELAKTNPKSLREHFGVESSTSRLMWTEWRSDFIYHDEQHRHAELFVRRDNESIKLLNITRQVMANLWPHASREFSTFAGMDFNAKGRAVILELFGEGRTVAEALTRQDTWTVLVTKEVAHDGSTQRLAETLRDTAGETCVWVDPHGARGHEARGTANTSDIAVVRQAGHTVAYANGTKDHKPRQLSQTASRNVMHALMASERYFVHARCVGTIDAMQNDLAKPDGKSDKRSSPDSESDLRTAYSDGVRYSLWPVFRSIVNADNGNSDT